MQMDQRGTGRGYRGGSRGHSSDRGGGSSRGGGRGGYNRDRGDRDSHHNRDGGDRGGSDREGKTHERPKKEAILDLSKYMDKQICVKFSGGREVVGLLKGYDQLMNLVLDEVKETIRDENGVEDSRDLGLVVARGPLLVLISPVDGSEQIENPFKAEEAGVLPTS